jgi:hypothetical protein
MTIKSQSEPDEAAETGRRIKLGDLKRTGGRTSVSATVLAGFNLNSRTLTVTMPMETFREVSDVANEVRIVEMGGDRSQIAQRPLDIKHAKNLALYMARGMTAGVKRVWQEQGRAIPDDLDDILSDLGEGPYQGLQPLTGNIRQCEPEGVDLDIEERPGGQLILFLRLGQLIYVIDGQHRRVAYDLLVSWLREILQAGKYGKRGLYVPERGDLGLTAEETAIWSAVVELARSHFTIDVTLHLGLKPDQERQLFHDLNNLGKKPDAALAQAFDLANPVSVYVRQHIEEKKLLGDIRISDAGSKKGSKNSDATPPSIYRDDLAVANALLFAGATNQATVTTQLVNPHVDYADRFWRIVASQPHFGTQDPLITLLAEPVMIKGLATLAHNFHGSREKSPTLRDQLLTDLAAEKINFSPADPLWALYLKSDSERDAFDPTLNDYLTPDAGRKTYAVIRDGRYDFAANTRDIARYLGDLIRWKLKLPRRPGLAVLKAKLTAQAVPKTMDAAA